MTLRRILLVDDEDGFHTLNTRTLTQNEICCVIDKVFDGEEALEYLLSSTEFPDVILLDINMPRMDGFSFLEEYQKLAVSKNCLVFILSTSQIEKHKKMAFSYPFVKGYFDKPLDQDAVNVILSHFKS
jgi:CheY-like chemotaxis protein